jgi:phosphatidylinositol phospholipase C delta
MPLKDDSDEEISIDKAKKEKAESLKMSSITALFGAPMK